MYKTQTIFHFPYPVPFTLKLSFIFPTLSPLPVFLCCVWRFLDSCQEPCRDISYEQWHCKLKSEWRNLIYKLFLLEVEVKYAGHKFNHSYFDFMEIGLYIEIPFYDHGN